MMRLPKPAETRKPFEGKHAELSEQIIKVFYQVHTELGYGFSEKVYQNAFAVALREAGMNVEEQIPIKRKIFDNENKGSLRWRVN